VGCNLEIVIAGFHPLAVAYGAGHQCGGIDHSMTTVQTVRIDMIYACFVNFGWHELVVKINMRLFMKMAIGLGTHPRCEPSLNE
jgi:hypothetical protein